MYGKIISLLSKHSVADRGIRLSLVKARFTEVIFDVMGIGLMWVN